MHLKFCCIHHAHCKLRISRGSRKVAKNRTHLGTEGNTRFVPSRRLGFGNLSSLCRILDKHSRPFPISNHYLYHTSDLELRSRTRGCLPFHPEPAFVYYPSHILPSEDRHSSSSNPGPPRTWRRCQTSRGNCHYRLSSVRSDRVPDRLPPLPRPPPLLRLPLHRHRQPRTHPRCESLSFHCHCRCLHFLSPHLARHLHRRIHLAAHLQVNQYTH